MLSKGDVGPAVKYLQAALNIHMFDCPEPLVVDGKFGPLTEARTALFQGRYDLLVDAIVGPLTTGMLCTYAVSEQHLMPGAFADKATDLTPSIGRDPINQSRHSRGPIRSQSRRQ